MLFIDRLRSINVLYQLEDLILKEYEAAYDYFLVQSHNDIKIYGNDIEQIITNKYSLISKLDLSKNINRNFVNLLIFGCERIGAFSLFEQLYRLNIEAEANISYRLKTVYKFTIGIRRFDDYLNIFDEVLINLKEAFDYEEDSIDIVVATFLQYYAKVVGNFGTYNNARVLSFKQKIEEQQKTNFILSQPIIDEVLTINTSDNDAFEQIQVSLDRFLNRTTEKCYNLTDEYLIESESAYGYADLLSKTEQKFYAIRKISVSIWNKIRNQLIFESLGRGTSIIKEEAQLYAYFNSYGNLHYAKMISALEKLCIENISGDLELFDWGCGQGLASMVLLEKYKSVNFSNITLIEPSDISIRRASLHIKHYNQNAKIKTLCKAFDSLKIDDIKGDKGNIKIHLFSNILDIDGYSLTELFELIKASQNGINYFICVSPYVNDSKADRVDSFSRLFSQIDSFEILDHKTNGGRSDDEYWNCNEKYNRGYCGNHADTMNCGCKNKWTRVIRVFKVCL